MVCDRSRGLRPRSAASTPGYDSCRRIAAAARSGALLHTLGLVGNCKAEPFTAEDPFDFAQGRLFAKLRTGSEDAEDISWTTPGGRDYRNGLGYMGEANRARRSGEPRYPRHLPTRQLPDGRLFGSNLRPPRQLSPAESASVQKPIRFWPAFLGFFNIFFCAAYQGSGDIPWWRFDVGRVDIIGWRRPDRSRETPVAPGERFRSPLVEESDLMRNPFQLPTSLVCCIATAMRRFIAGGVGRLFWAVLHPRKVQNAVRAATAPRGLPTPLRGAHGLRPVPGVTTAKRGLHPRL
jgi:hypothetical protein